MFKLIVLAALAAIAVRLFTGRWPWDYLRRNPGRREAVLQARQLLGLRAGASAEEIRAAHRRRIAEVHPDRGGAESAVHEADAARDLLLAETTKSELRRPE